MARAAMIVDRMFPKNRNTTMVTNSAPRNKVRMVSSTDRRMYLD